MNEKMDVSAYKAYEMREKIAGRNPITIEDRIREVLNSGETLKKAEIDQHVSDTNRIAMGTDLQAEVSVILSKLEKDGLVVHVEHGYWRKK